MMSVSSLSECERSASTGEKDRMSLQSLLRFANADVGESGDVVVRCVVLERFFPCLRLSFLQQTHLQSAVSVLKAFWLLVSPMSALFISLSSRTFRMILSHVTHLQPDL